MKVGELVAMLEQLNSDHVITAVVMRDMVENEGGPNWRSMAFDVDRIVSTIVPRKDSAGFDSAYVRNVIHLRPDSAYVRNVIHLRP